MQNELISQVEKLVSNFMFVANIRILLIFVSALTLVHFDICPGWIIILAVFQAVIHACLLTICNRSYQAYLSGNDKLDKFVQWLDYASLGLFALFFITASILTVI